MRHLLVILVFMGTTSCAVDRESPEALTKFAFDPEAVYFASSSLGTTRAYCPVRADKSFVLCNSAENYVFSSNDFNGDSVTLRDGDDVFVLERAPFEGTGKFALVSNSSGYGSSFSFTTPSTASFTFDITGPGTVIYGGSDEKRLKLERLMRGKFGPSADGLTFTPVESVAVTCGPNVPITNNISECKITGDAPLGSIRTIIQ